MASQQTLHRTTQAGSSVHLSIHSPLSVSSVASAQCLKQTYKEGQMLNSSRNVFTGSPGTRTNNLPWKYTHVLWRYCTQTHTKNFKDCKVIYNERLFCSSDFLNGCGHVCVAPSDFRPICFQFTLSLSQHLKPNSWIKAEACCFVLFADFPYCS